MEKDRKTEHPLISGLDERWAEGKGQGEQADRAVCVYVRERERFYKELWGTVFRQSEEILLCQGI